MAGVPGSVFLALSATASALGVIPAAAVALLLGVDRIMDSMRVATNLLGNCVAVFAVSRWEGALDRVTAKKALERRGARRLAVRPACECRTGGAHGGGGAGRARAPARAGRRVGQHLGEVTYGAPGGVAVTGAPNLLDPPDASDPGALGGAVRSCCGSLLGADPAGVPATRPASPSPFRAASSSSTARA